MFQKVLNYINDNCMIEAEDEILAGVSGGADSVCLFFLLKKLQEKIPFHLTVMHINHNLRETAKRDEKFVENLCREHEINYIKESVDVVSLVKEEGLSIEEAARIARYDAFKKQAQFMNQKTKKTVKLAVAHHKNDQAETVLFHLFRGCSLSGLRGMKPVRNEGELLLIRPMLCVSREEIEEFLNIHGLSYMTDETNLDIQYSRNRIRNQILPIVEESICQGAISHIAKTASDIKNVEDFLDDICKKEYEKVVKYEKKEKLSVCCNEFKKMHNFLQHEIIYRVISELAGVKKDITRVHIQTAFELFGGQVGRQVDLPYGICARKTYESVEFFVKNKDLISQEEKEIEEIVLNIPGTTFLSCETHLKTKVFSYDKSQEIPKKKYTKWFDYDKIKRCLVVRKRDVCDYFYIDGHHKKKVKDYMKNEKIDREKRDKLFLICDEHHMVWLPGYRISAYYKVSNETKKILEVSYIGGTKDDRDN